MKQALTTIETAHQMKGEKWEMDINQKKMSIEFKVLRFFFKLLLKIKSKNEIKLKQP